MKTYELLNLKIEIEDLGLPLPTRRGRGDIKLADNGQHFFVELGYLKISTKSVETEFKAYVGRYALAGALIDGSTRAKDDDGFFWFSIWLNF